MVISLDIKVLSLSEGEDKGEGIRNQIINCLYPLHSFHTRLVNNRVKC